MTVGTLILRVVAVLGLIGRHLLDASNICMVFKVSSEIRTSDDLSLPLQNILNCNPEVLVDGEECRNVFGDSEISTMSAISSNPDQQTFEIVSIYPLVDCSISEWDLTGAILNVYIPHFFKQHVFSKHNFIMVMHVNGYPKAVGHESRTQLFYILLSIHKSNRQQSKIPACMGLKLNVFKKCSNFVACILGILKITSRPVHCMFVYAYNQWFQIIYCTVLEF